MQRPDTRLDRFLRLMREDCHGRSEHDPADHERGDRWRRIAERDLVGASPADWERAMTEIRRSTGT